MCKGCCSKGQPEYYNDKRKFINSEYTDAPAGHIPYPSNFIRTSKYTALNFMPKSLLAQFRRFANIYFLGSAIL